MTKMPTGWPIGTYLTYTEAEHALDYLAHHDFPLHDVTIVGVEPVLVGRVTADVTLSRALRVGALYGAWIGLLAGLMMTLSGAGSLLVTLFSGLVTGVGCGAAFAGLTFGAVTGRHAFSTASELVAQRYDLVCDPRNVDQGRALLAELA